MLFLKQILNQDFFRIIIFSKRKSSVNKNCNTITKKLPYNFAFLKLTNYNVGIRQKKKATLFSYPSYS